MAWYRCGGGGIPSSLKTNMDAVLNKKFGTSTTYAPATWPDNVNLLGPLPEKTASGSVANITDGADGVPVKNWGVTVDATLSGVSSVVCTQAGKNLLAKEIVRYSNSLATLSECFAIHHGTYTVTIGTVANANNWRLSVLLMDGEGNALTDNSYKPSNDLQLATNRWRYGSNTTTKDFTVTIVTDCYVRFFIELGDTSSSTTVSDSYLEVGSTSTTYTPYIAPIVTTVSLGRTIYGGSVDVVNGTGTETYLKIVLDGTQEIGLANWKPTTGTSAWLYAPSVTTNLLNNYLTAYNLDNIVCDVLPTVPYNTTAQRIDESTTKGISVVGTNNLGLAVRVEDDTLRTKADINAWLANNPITVIYKVATPEDFTFPPITPTPETALGVNNFWADEGESDVTYRADINMLIVSLSGNRGLMMTRPQLEEITEETKEESPEVTEK